MIHAIIVDDELHGLKSLEILIQDFCEGVNIVGKTTDAIEAIALINLYRPDVVFLDIAMPKLNGFDVLERLEYRKFYLVFTTAYHQYALRALKQGATDYLLKPINVAELQKAFEKVKYSLAAEERQPDVYEMLQKVYLTRNMKVHLPTKSATEYVLPNDIVYIEANSKHATVGLVNGTTVNVTNGLKDYEQQLCREDLNFMRVHHSFIVNLHYIVRCLKDGSTLTMTGKKIIPVSRQKKDEVLRVIHNNKKTIW